MSGGVHGAPDRGNVNLEAMKEVAKDTREELITEQKTSDKALAHDLKNPLAAAFKKTQKDMKTRFKKVSKTMEMKEKAGKLPLAAIKKTADEFSEGHPEHNKDSLVLLRSNIKPDASPETILKTVLAFYSDPSLADEALDFLLLTTEGDLHARVQEAKNQYNESHGREITAGRNIHQEARAASKDGLGSPTEMRDMYRDITGNPRDAHTLFIELSSKYSYRDLSKVARFLLHSMGSDMNSGGPSIEPGKLHNLITEVRSVQATLGVYAFFKGRNGLIKQQFEKEGAQIPPELNFENLARGFMQIAAERYPTSQKVQQEAKRLGVDNQLAGKMIALEQLRDAVRQVSTRVYRSTEHRDQVTAAIIECLEEVYDQMEVEEENEELME